MFGYFITHAINDRYNPLCYLVEHDKKQPDYEDENSSIADRLIPKHVTTEELEALGDTLNFIEICLKRLDHNYEVICGIYNEAMKEI